MKEKKFVILFIVLSTFFSFFFGIIQIHNIHKKNLIELNLDISEGQFYGFHFHFYGDAGFKWLQIQDLKSKNFFDISCSYPGKEFDPNFSFSEQTGVITIQNETCYYLFPYALSYIMYLPTLLGGQIGILIFQHILVGFVLYWMFKIGKIINLDFWKIFISIILIRFGTSYGLSVFDLEEHILTGFIFTFSIYRLLIKPNNFQIWFSGFLIGSLFLIRPETVVNIFVYPLAISYLSKNYDIKTKKNRLLLGIFGISLSILSICLLNQSLVNHPLGIKAFDPIHYVSFGERISGLIRNLFFYSPFYFNPLFFQMPIFVLALLDFRFNKFIKYNSEIKFLFSFLYTIPILVLIAPTSATYYLGLRFIYYLYPILILLALYVVDFNSLKRKVLFFCLCTWSLITFVLSLKISFSIYKGYDSNYQSLQNHKQDIVFVRDIGALMSLSDLYLEGKNILVFEERFLPVLIQNVKKNNPYTEISIIQSQYLSKPDDPNFLIKGYEIKSKFEKSSINIHTYKPLNK